MIRRKGQSHRPVVFIVELLETFEIVVPVVSALRRMGVPVRIVVTPERDVMHHHSSNGEWYDGERARIVWEWLVEHRFRPERLQAPELARRQVQSFGARAVFLQTPYTQQRHSSLDWRVIGAPVHYVDYGFHVDPEEVSGWRFSDEFFLNCAAIYVANEYEGAKFLDGGVDPRVIVRSGPPALDHWDQFTGRAEVPTVMWCPWWSMRSKVPGKVGYSTFMTSYEAVLAEARARSNVRFIIRPHPLMFGQLIAEGQWAENDQHRFESMVAQLANVTLIPTDKASSHTPQFEEAWAMVTDGVSFLAEFAYTGKPLLLTEAPNNQGWNPVGQAIRRVVDVSQGVSELGPFLDRVESSSGRQGTSQRRAVASQYFRPSGGSGRAIARHLASRT
jgi:hypothetical protein